LGGERAESAGRGLVVPSQSRLEVLKLLPL